MAFQFENLLIDRVISGIFEDSKGLIAAVNQLKNVSIETTSESTDATDALGAVIKRFYTAKSVEVSAENAIFSTSLAGVQFGMARQSASSSNKIIMPKIITINTDTITADASGNKKYTLPDTPITGTMSVYGCTNGGVPDTNKIYSANTASSNTEYVIADKLITLPTDVSGTIMIKYDREVDSGFKLTQKTDKFPKTCKLTLSVLTCDPCDTETFRHAYIVFPSFQMSPDNTISLTSEEPQSFSGIAQRNYCDNKHELFSIYMSEDDIAESDN